MSQAKANGVSSASAGVGMTGAATESADVQGMYHGVCVGYKAAHEKEYLGLWPRLQALRAQASAAFAKELADLEEYMASLTEVKWDSLAKNTVMTVGKNAMFDNGILGASAYTKVGPFMGLIGAVSYVSVPVAADTMASHATWTEAGTTNAPTYTGPRKTISFSAASAGSTGPSSAPVYAMTGTGTVKGVFLVCHTGAVSTIDSTAGTLWSAGLFSGGDQAVVNTNTVTVTYTTSM